MMNEINELKNRNNAVDKKLLEELDKRFDTKISGLGSKYKPSTIKKNEHRKTKKKVKDKKSRERYLARQIIKRIHNYNKEDKKVINLSRVTLSMAQIFALDLGYGYVFTPNYIDKEEEMLILEGFRVMDKIGKLDDKITKEMNRYNEKERNEALNNYGNENFGNESLDESFHGFADNDNFVRSTAVPKFLRFSQPVERKLNQPITKLVLKEFEEFNNGLIEKIRGKPKRKFYNQPKKIRDAIFDLKKLVKEKVIDIRKVDKGQLIIVIDYEQRHLIEEENIKLISERCVIQKSNWEENRKYVEEQMKLLYNLKFIEKN